MKFKTIAIIATAITIPTFALGHTALNTSLPAGELSWQTIYAYDAEVQKLGTLELQRKMDACGEDLKCVFASVARFNNQAFTNADMSMFKTALAYYRHLVDMVSNGNEPANPKLEERYLEILQGVMYCLDDAACSTQLTDEWGETQTDIKEFRALHLKI